MPAPAAKHERNRFRLRDLADASRQMRRLLPYMLRYWPRLLIYFLAMGLFVAGSYGRALIVEPLVSHLQDAGADGAPASFDLYWAALVMLGAAIAMALGTWGKEYHMSWIQQRASLDVQSDLVKSLMRQPVSFFNTTRKGELMSRVTNDLSGVRATFFVIFNDLFAHPVTILGGIAALVWTSPTLSLFALVLPLILLPVIVLAGKIRKLSRRSFESHAELTNFFHQFFEGIRVVKAFGMETQQVASLDQSANTYFERSVRVGKYKGLSRALVEIVLGLMMAGGLLIGAWLLHEGTLGTEVSVGVLLQFFALLVLLYDPLRKLSHTLNNMSAALAANERVFELMDREPEFREPGDAVDAPTLRRDICFENVSFAYLADRPVLRDISFVAPRGSMTALVGHTGAGKSTLVDLIPRFYLPTTGRILVDGVDLAQIRGASWMAQIAVVSQETFLFNTTVRNNLLSARPDASEAEVREALRAANIEDEVLALPKGLDTPLGDRGVNLSGGQRQRLAIARAFVKRAPVLLLDEATSALDSATERKVQEALERLIQGATVFAIAHRLSTIMHADQILVLEHGGIVERGTHDELLARGGVYAQLFTTQFRKRDSQPVE